MPVIMVYGMGMNTEQTSAAANRERGKGGFVKASDYAEGLRGLSDDELENERFTWEVEWQLIGESRDRARVRVDLILVEQHRRRSVPRPGYDPRVDWPERHSGMTSE